MCHAELARVGVRVRVSWNPGRTGRSARFGSCSHASVLPWTAASGWASSAARTSRAPSRAPPTWYACALLHSHPCQPELHPDQHSRPNRHRTPRPDPDLHPHAHPHPHPNPNQNNHLRFIVKYHKSDTFSGARIVGFEVEAYSVKHTYEGECRRTLIPSALLLLPRAPLFPGYHPAGGAPARLGSVLLSAPDVATTHSLGPPSETPPFRCRAKWRPLHVLIPTIPSAAQVEPQGAEAHLGPAASRPSTHARCQQRGYRRLLEPQPQPSP